MMQATIIYKGPIEGKVKGLGAEVKASLQQQLVTWHQTYLDPHFDTLAKVQSRYPNVYRPRGKDYMIRKANKYGHQNTLEFSGQTRREVSRSISVSGTSKQARGRMSGANRGLNWSGRSNMPDMRSEILAWNPDEIDALATQHGERIAKFLEDKTETETVRI